MLKIATTAALTAALAIIGITVVEDAGDTVAVETGLDRLAGMPVCEEVVVTAERPGWLIDEVVAVAERPESTESDRSLRTPWLHETEVAGLRGTMPEVVN